MKAGITVTNLPIRTITCVCMRKNHWLKINDRNHKRNDQKKDTLITVYPEMTRRKVCRQGYTNKNYE